MLDLIFDHRKVVIQEFLKTRKHAYSGTREKLRQRVEGYLDDGSVRADELVELLNRVEGWGNQHIFLYKAPAALIDRWNTEAKVRASLRTQGQEMLFNRPRPLVLPKAPQLCSVEWTPTRARLVWVEKRVWRERAPEEDFGRDDLEFTASRVRRSRGLIAFDWDLVSGDAALLIERLPTGNDYGAERRRFELELEPLVKISKFEGVYVSSAIPGIEKSGEVRHRQLEHATERGARISFVSRAKNVCALADPALRKARDALGDALAGRHGNYYWPMPGEEPREVHVKLYAKDQRLALFGECSEGEVRHVLRCVRGHCC
ncbi:MAG: hypothetical protein JNM56_00660 [Planctomycetia bacterium]|nr:hypothetical protein [Planctomycetia bacterium]